MLDADLQGLKECGAELGWIFRVLLIQFRPSSSPPHLDHVGYLPTAGRRRIPGPCVLHERHRRSCRLGARLGRLQRRSASGEQAGYTRQKGPPYPSTVRETRFGDEHLKACVKPSEGGGAGKPYIRSGGTCLVRPMCSSSAGARRSCSRRARRSAGRFSDPPRGGCGHRPVNRRMAIDRVTDGQRERAGERDRERQRGGK